ncbi:death-associated inhibitor of apoptosis 1-like [Maniola hyperantus]|uniref:death-associated inhibitor of apoptosis 1-like n=1 Tax=Aphantopus hyperantus TaxID=2795564 RepID=UPI0015697866|nr:death-associated inhibitor of apoptosis 1-like [Maniola hyperantus]XP_034827845.1 death-associated inhibitor of apoptosis 1-like [Maniola hyperantus]
MEFLYPKYPSYATQIARLRSFDTWPQGLNQKPQEMADAGFFYTGKSDRVICYFCDGGLKDWDIEDLPWSEHARWFPSCPYVLLVMGETYIQTIAKDVCGTSKDSEQFVNNNTISSKFAGRNILCVENAEETFKLCCKICLVEEVGMCYRPCGHAITCIKCALSLDKMLCPICRKAIVSVIRIYF